MLKLMPSAYSSRLVAASTAGTTSAAIRVSFQLRRNTNSTAVANSTPRMMASRTEPAEAVISPLWSYHWWMRTSAGSLSRNAANAAVMSRLMATVLPPSCWYTLTSTAGLPSAVSVCQRGTVAALTVATSSSSTTPSLPVRSTVWRMASSPLKRVSDSSRYRRS